MLHVIELPRTGINLASWLAEMRVWLDHNRIDVAAFERSRGDSETGFKISFSDATNATAFAQAFTGRRLLPATDQRSK